MKRALALSLTLSSLGLTPGCVSDGGESGATSSGGGGDSGSAALMTGGTSGSAGQAPGSAGQAPDAGQAAGGSAVASGSGSGSIGPGGSPGTGGHSGSGASPTGGVSSGRGGEASSGGAAVATDGGRSGDGAALDDCSFSVTTNEVSPQMATVGIVEWSVNGVPTDAKVVYELAGASPEVLNRGGEAPVDLERKNYRTLLLGLKQESSYSFVITATVEGETCVSESYSLPGTGTLSRAPSFSVTVDAPQAREPGFIVATSGYAGNPDIDATAYIIDADGDSVWAAPAPPDASRAKMDYEGENMWMLGVNFSGGFGEMRYLSMDGQTEQKDVEGLERAHHDFAVMPGGKVATMAWTDLVFDPESDLVIRSPDGTLETAFRIGANLYASSEDRYHSNAIHYIEQDDSFTISDRNPSLFVKVSSSGELQWQLGGSCDGAPARPDKCSGQSWLLNHGHHLLSDGSFVLFNNQVLGGGSHVIELDILEAEGSMGATISKDYEGTSGSGILGDVQRLPGGNTLITYSDAAQLVEVDADWQVVQTFDGDVGYADWRRTLYGPPDRL